MSGKYIQGKRKLIDDEGHHCCLGVLSVLCNIPIDKDGYSTVNAEGKTNYEFFLEMELPVNELIKANDNEHENAGGPNGYKAVIPIIESILTPMCNPLSMSSNKITTATPIATSPIERNTLASLVMTHPLPSL